MNNIFSRAFNKVLLEAAVESEISDTDAMISTLDPETDPNVFETDSPTVRAVKAMQEAESAMQVQVNDWVQQITDFIDFLNGTGPNSIQTLLKDSVEGTLFDKISSAESKRLSRAAVELSALNETLKGYTNAKSDTPNIPGVPPKA